MIDLCPMLISSLIQAVGCYLKQPPLVFGQAGFFYAVQQFFYAVQKKSSLVEKNLKSAEAKANLALPSARRACIMVLELEW